MFSRKELTELAKSDWAAFGAEKKAIVLYPRDLDGLEYSRDYFSAVYPVNSAQMPAISVIEETPSNVLQWVGKYKMHDAGDSIELPSLNIESSWQQFCSKASELPNGEEIMKKASEIYTKTRDLVTQLEPFEVKLASKAPRKYPELWESYLKHARRLFFKSKSSKLMILKVMLAIFERALYEGLSTEQFEAVDLFYYEFLRILMSLKGSKTKLDSQIVQFIDGSNRVYTERYVQLFENSFRAWQYFFKNVSRSSLDPDFVDAIESHVRSSLLSPPNNTQGHLNLCSGYLVFQSKSKSNMLDDLNFAFDLQQHTQWDSSIFIERLVIEICLQKAQNNEAQQFCRKLMKRSANRHWTWLTCLSVGHRIQSIQFVRSVYKLAAENVEQLEWPQPLIRDWIWFEQMYGDEKNANAAEKWEAYLGLEETPQENEEDEENEANEAEQEVKEAENKPVSFKKRKIDQVDDVEEDGNAKKQNTRSRESLRVKLTNVSSSTTQHDIARFFKDCGEIKDVQFRESGVFVEFEEEKAVLAALTKTFKQLNGQSVTVEKAENCTIFVSNFSPLETEETIKQFFGKVGTVVDVRFPSLKYNTSRRFCYVEFENHQGALNAVKKYDNTNELNKQFEHPLVVKISAPGDKKQRQQSHLSMVMDEKREVFIRNLNFDITENEIMSLFGEYGEIEKVKIPISPKAQLQKRGNEGYAFVTFYNASSAANCVRSLNDTEVKGRAISVVIADKKKPQSHTKKVITSFKPSSGDISQRIVCISNLKDTVTGAQIKEWLEKNVGDVNKIDYRPQWGKALVEFTSVSNAGKAGLIIGGKGILEGATVGPEREFNSGNNRRARRQQRLQHKEERTNSGT